MVGIRELTTEPEYSHHIREAVSPLQMLAIITVVAIAKKN